MIIKMFSMIIRKIAKATTNKAEKTENIKSFCFAFFKKRTGVGRAHE